MLNIYLTKKKKTLFSSTLKIFLNKKLIWWLQLTVFTPRFEISSFAILSCTVGTLPSLPLCILKITLNYSKTLSWKNLVEYLEVQTVSCKWRWSHNFSESLFFYHHKTQFANEIHWAATEVLPEGELRRRCGDDHEKLRQYAIDLVQDWPGIPSQAVLNTPASGITAVLEFKDKDPLKIDSKTGRAW